VGAAALVETAQPAAAVNGSTVLAGNVTTAETRTSVLYDGASGYQGVVLLGNDSGKAAQIQLIAGTGATHPTSGKTGDLYVDKTARLWFCKAGGTTATWVKIV
jgi:hypothetical protein